MSARVSAFVLVFLLIHAAHAQTNPAITSWLINTTGVKGSHYVQGNSTLIPDNDSANVKKVYYSANYAYIKANGVPAYPTGPFMDGNPSFTTSQNAIFRIPLNPTPDPTPSSTTGGNIGTFINGVALFDYRDGVSWNNNTQAEAGGPSGGMGQGVWNRDAIVAERAGFDCAKGHPAMGNYHHHQNPSAFKLDMNVLSTICNLYDAEGLYAIDSSQHSPLLGFAADGYPIYGAYGYKNTDGSGGITRIKSGYQLRNITVRTHYADGTNVTDGPAVSATYPLGRYREDYEYIAHASDPDYLDVHNGRFCVTPEYPNGIYAYFCTVDRNWNSAYPYVVGPTFYGNTVTIKVNSINETVTAYTGTSAIGDPAIGQLNIVAFPNPGSDFIAVQIYGLLRADADVLLYDLNGRLVQSAQLKQGSTITYLDTRTLYNGAYVLQVLSGQYVHTQKVLIARE
ncbi:MAG: YHYH protein [Bacteroidetes bacterium]|nr:MAG: YHYH protein [Bacteroidota bacterium]